MSDVHQARQSPATPTLACSLCSSRCPQKKKVAALADSLPAERLRCSSGGSGVIPRPGVGRRRRLNTAGVGLAGLGQHDKNTSWPPSLRVFFTSAVADNTGPVAVAFLRMVSQHRQAGTGLGKHTPSLASSSAPVHRHSAMHPGADRGGLALLSRWLRRAASRCIVLLPKLEPADRLKRPDVENERPCQSI